MDDSIYRQAVLKMIENYRKSIGIRDDMTEYTCVRGLLFAIESGIKSLPAAHSEIIKCKDCKYMTEHYDTDGNVPYWTCSEWDSGTDYDGFCHYAERRDNE